MSVDPRTDPQHARDVFETLVESLDERRAVIASFVKAIEAVADEPRSWSVTLAKDNAFVRLNVGPILLFGIERECLWVSVELDSVSEEVLAKAPPSTDMAGEDRYKSLDQVGTLGVLYGSCTEILPKIEQALLAAVTLAKRRKTPYWPSYSPGVLDFLEAEVGRPLPRPEHPRDEDDDRIRQRLVAYVRQKYPDWLSFDDPAFVDDEITYKRQASALARELLDRDALASLVAAHDWDEFRERLLKVANATNLLYRSTPLTGDLAPLHADHIDPPDLYREVFGLLHGEGDTPDRIDRFVAWAGERNIKATWPFLTYFLFLLRPDREIIVKPVVSDAFLQAMGESLWVSGRISGKTYDRFRNVIFALVERFADLGAEDLIDAQSLLFVIARAIQELPIRAPLLHELRELIAECKDNFHNQDAGRTHLGHYRLEAENLRQNLEAIRAASSRGEDITGRVLLGLLPHTDSDSNRRKGAWISTAPTIQGDLKRWFQNAGWQKADDWPEVARALFTFFDRVDRAPDELDAACAALAGNPLSKGFQAAMLSPALAALAPDRFRIVNSKITKVLNRFCEVKHTTKLEEYPEVNELLARLVRGLESDLQTDDDKATPAQAFDSFCHWLVAIKRYDFRNVSYWKVAPGENAWQWEECRDNGFIAIGWDDIGDVTGLSRREFEEIRDAAMEERTDYTKTGTDMVWHFSRIREGDRIVANRGTEEVLGIGTVTGPYYYAPAARYHHRLPVEWDDTTPRKVSQPGWRRTLIKLSPETFRSILEAHAIEAKDPKPPPRPDEQDSESAFVRLLGAIADRDLFFPSELVANFLLALQTKRFVILTGISGTGKTKLAQIVARHFGPTGGTNYEVIAVRPDWTDQRGLLGYYNPLTERYSATPFLHLLLRAEKERSAAEDGEREARPFFAILDEMNLARVEHYFSDFLSAMESGEPIHLHDVPAGVEAGLEIPGRLSIPSNVYFIGTVNVDESTYMFSPKVLDRAFTIELNRVDLARVGTTDDEGLSLGAMPPALDGARKPGPKDWLDLKEHVDAVDAIVEINRVLATDNRHFGYRVANEMARFVLLGTEQADSDEKTVRGLLDLALLQKVLPKLHGTQQELEELLARLFAFAVDGHLGSMGASQNHDDLDSWQVDQRSQLIASKTASSEETSPGPPAFPRTAAKLWRMRRRLVQQGFTSFIE